MVLDGILSPILMNHTNGSITSNNRGTTDGAFHFHSFSPSNVMHSATPWLPASLSVSWPPCNLVQSLHYCWGLMQAVSAMQTICICPVPMSGSGICLVRMSSGVCLRWWYHIGSHFILLLKSQKEEIMNDVIFMKIDAERFNRCR